MSSLSSAFHLPAAQTIEADLSTLTVEELVERRATYRAAQASAEHQGRAALLAGNAALHAIWTETAVEYAEQLDDVTEELDARQELN